MKGERDGSTPEGWTGQPVPAAPPAGTARTSALINCPDCDRQISRLAPSCPGCGRPMNQQGTPNVQPTTMIEKTSKRYKKQIAIGAAICFVGVILTAVGVALNESNGYVRETPHPLLYVGVLMMIVGCAKGIVAGIQAWWHHG